MREPRNVGHWQPLGLLHLLHLLAHHHEQYKGEHHSRRYEHLSVGQVAVDDECQNRYNGSCERTQKYAVQNNQTTDL